MGNTVLAHILYSCNQVDLDLDTFFSDVADAHLINKYNDTALTSMHLDESNDSYKCLITLYADDFYDLLVLKLSYSKWHKSFPMLSNYKAFFSSNFEVADTTWLDFYTAVKDPSWPMCNSLADVKYLPSYIQKEVAQYKEPNDTVSTDDILLQFLTLSYYDMFSFSHIVPDQCKDAVKYKLSSYLTGDFDVLATTVHKQFDWNFSKSRSEQFYGYVKEKNRLYLLWFEKVLKIYNGITSFNSVDVTLLDTWEKASILAKVCYTRDLHPAKLKWDTINTGIINLKEII